MDLFQKIRTVVLVNVHKLLDKAINLDSPEAIKQYIRDLEASIGKLTESVVQATGNKRTEEENLTRVRTQKKEINENIEIILADDDEENDKLAIPLEARLIAKEKEEETLSASVEEIAKVEKELTEALGNLKGKHATMVSRLNELEILDRSSKAKDAAAKALERANGAGLEGAEASVDNVEAKIRRNKNVADARFERAMADVDDTVSKDVTFALAKDRLAKRKEAMGKK